MPTARTAAATLAALTLTACAAPHPPTAATTTVLLVQTPTPLAAAAPHPADPATSPLPAISTAPTRPRPSPTRPSPTGPTTRDYATLPLTGDTGIAVVPVGTTTPTLHLGTLTTAAAWSTMKVPVTIAALHHDPTLDAPARRAITASDNDAAATLWTSLGPPTTAATTTQALLTTYGDPTTTVQATRTRPPYSAFGQTSWPLTAAATFTAHLPCHPDAAPVLALMHQVDPDQRWGLGALPGAAIKGGWGPEGQGYLARQIAITDTPTGQVAVAIASRNPAGMSAATHDLDTITTWLRHLLPTLHGGHC